MDQNRAFANGTEWDAWSAGWCNRCLHEETCPIVDQLLLGDGSVPVQWTVGPYVLGPERYACTEFREAGK